MKPMTMATLSEANGLPYALKMFNINGRIADSPVKFAKKINEISIKIGFNVRLCRISASFSHRVGDAWPHFRCCSMHELHDFERSMDFCSS